MRPAAAQNGSIVPTVPARTPADPLRPDGRRVVLSNLGEYSFGVDCN